MKLLITGGCGFLGSNLASQALLRGIDLVVFDNLSRKGAAENLEWLRTQGRFEFVQADIRVTAEVERVVGRFSPDAVFHLAGQVAMTTSIANPRLDFEVNALGTLNLLESLRRLAPSAGVIYSSTNKVYGDLEDFTYQEQDRRYVCPARPAGFDESTPLEFHSPYGCSKGAADQYMLDYSRIFDLNTVVFRHSSMYGGRQFATCDQGWVGWFCQQALEQAEDPTVEACTISGNGKQVRDVLHADDMVRLYFLALEKIGSVRGEVFNIGGGMENSLSLLELFEILEAKTGVRLRYRQLAPRQSDQKVFVADIAKARRLLGWHPQVAAGRGVGEMVDWIAGWRDAISD